MSLTSFHGAGLRRLAMAAAVVLAVAAITAAQIPQVTNLTMLPSPGSGHDY